MDASRVLYLRQTETRTSARDFSVVVSIFFNPSSSPIVRVALLHLMRSKTESPSETMRRSPHQLIIYPIGIEPKRDCAPRCRAQCQDASDRTPQGAACGAAANFRAPSPVSRGGGLTGSHPPPFCQNHPKALQKALQLGKRSSDRTSSMA